jgi:hypothetical protein
MMKSMAGAALGALILFAGAAPAFAGGYWDAGNLPDPPGAAGPSCNVDRPCPPPPCPQEQRSAWRERDQRGGDHAWSRDSGWSEDSGWRVERDQRDSGWDENRDGYDDEGAVIPSEFFDNGGGVGPDTFVDYGGGGGGGSAGAGAFAGADAFAGASASASVDVNIGFHGHDHGHHMMPPRPKPCPPQQHMGYSRMPHMAMHGWSGGGRRR